MPEYFENDSEFQSWEKNALVFPEAVSNLKAENVTGTSTHLSWDPPSSTKCADHYKITYCSYLYDEVRECAIKTAILALNTTQYDTTDLKPCRYNLVKVYTVGTEGSEIYTEMMLYTGSGDPPKLDKVNLKFVGADSITLGWDLPGTFDAQCYPGFRVCYSVKGDREETCTETPKQEFSTSSVATLSPCTEYNFSVVTVDGNFAPDSKTSDKTYVSVVTAPQMPDIKVNVVNHAEPNHAAHATWQAPDELSMSCAASYLVKNCRMTDVPYSEDCRTVFSFTLPLNVTEATASNLTGCTNNHVSFNLVGHNGYSSGRGVVVLDYECEIPTPTEVTVLDLTLTQFTLDYYKGEKDCVDLFRACWIAEGERENCWYTAHSYTNTFTDAHLTPCANYTLNFFALGRNMKLSNNYTTSFLTGPHSNSLNQTIEVGSHSALLSWEMQPSALQCGTHYSFTWKKQTGDDSGKNSEVPVNTTSYNITGLSACTQYIVTYFTQGVEGSSSEKKATTFKTLLGDVGPITNSVFYYVSDTLYIDIGFPGNSLDCLSTFVTCWYETGGSKAQEKCGEGTLYWVDGSLKSCVNYTFVVTANTTDHKTTSGSTTYTPGTSREIIIS
ncbi:hypothetical protein PR048_004411 [Dryococelus australis]|uniref:Fibronectin type-III domain-containing protein n=1 Tax=Dryococelus australis TaxID=614101 RepID=A0ABQ9I5C7_9NEOP|nr:hypothetical protein PR048_004411 [Dryococelus australis]